MRFVTADGFRTSVIGLGTHQFGTPDWGWGREFGPAEATAICKRALALGITLFDTAERYGGGDSERVLGRAVTEPGVREAAQIATKLQPRGSSPAATVTAARASLDRLGTDHIDLYQLHWPDLDSALPATMSAMRELQDAGLVRHVGISNHSLAQWRRAEELLGRPVVSNQVRYSLLTRDAEAELLPFAASTGHLVLAYGPLEQGVLTGKHTPAAAPRVIRHHDEFLSPRNLRRAGPLLEALRELAAAHDATPAQVALAWIVRHPNVVAIPGATSVQQLEQNAAAADLVLADDEFAHLTAVSDRFRAARQPIRAARRKVVWRWRQLIGRAA
jgi:aryl-alcohol dehydrogenase-like predicted oxidoreductase